MYSLQWTKSFSDSTPTYERDKTHKQPVCLQGKFIYMLWIWWLNIFIARSRVSLTTELFQSHSNLGQREGKPSEDWSAGHTTCLPLWLQGGPERAKSPLWSAQKLHAQRSLLDPAFAIEALWALPDSSITREARKDLSCCTEAGRRHPPSHKRCSLLVAANWHCASRSQCNESHYCNRISAAHAPPYPLQTRSRLEVAPEQLIEVWRGRGDHPI